MLETYGFSFSDAQSPTQQELQLPEGELLLPASGALVKSPNDSTIWLISLNVRYGFSSSQVFKNLGYKFENVLTVTLPELERQQVGIVLNNPNAAHLPGMDINLNGTIYWIGDDMQLHGYPSLNIYNSWHIDNDFSKIVNANTADYQYKIGSVLLPRIY